MLEPTLSESPAETVVGNYFISNYPPFSTWSPEEVPEVERVLERRSGERLSLYVHLPFCRQRCRYCYFRVYARSGPETVDAYVDALLRELSLYLRRPLLEDRRLVSVYFGGGTPSYLGVNQIRRLLEGLRQLLNWDGVVECTFECEPGTVSERKLQPEHMHLCEDDLAWELIDPETGAAVPEGERANSSSPA